MCEYVCEREKLGLRTQPISKEVFGQRNYSDKLSSISIPERPSYLLLCCYLSSQPLLLSLSLFRVLYLSLSLSPSLSLFCFLIRPRSLSSLLSYFLSFFQFLSYIFSFKLFSRHSPLVHLFISLPHTYSSSFNSSHKHVLVQGALLV